MPTLNVSWHSQRLADPAKYAKAARVISLANHCYSCLLALPGFLGTFSLRQATVNVFAPGTNTNIILSGHLPKHFQGLPLGLIHTFIGGSLVQRSGLPAIEVGAEYAAIVVYHPTLVHACPLGVLNRLLADLKALQS
ncbi:hypothetical protein A2311_02620 [candidate division WOR-1 bacterium RIFOXYB2_FULL_48_7]|uniref:Uncharacterized protein n=1 Tax=candidate division WOR-1 bacterium RIFOXYB2_FULL_48_7 TaxID=1802583 RepID=A0A1F4TR08_UNCSA|nr:MAG: hypothetical protein A2311_02620 [candidate division WOR-1 bacterium RIFOXYB2_FULL_48_7]